MVVAIAAVVLIILGVYNGSAKAVHTKAANICTECVGLG
ncbi:MAG: thioredoxin [Firmicutes bacterium]|nr:thioredoxin [Bacillota bacterium]